MATLAGVSTAALAASGPVKYLLRAKRTICLIRSLQQFAPEFGSILFKLPLYLGLFVMLLACVFTARSIAGMTGWTFGQRY